METETSADLALLDGKILTMNKTQPLAEAIAIKKNRIIKVGTTEEVSRLIGKDTKIVYLEYHTVLPGLIDTHIHVADFGRFLMWLDLTETTSIVQMLNLLAKRLDSFPSEKWVVGRGWNEKKFIEKRLPTRYDLDIISPNNPVLFYHAEGLVCVVNSKALELAVISINTPAPEGGIIEKDPITGIPTGVLRESATNLIWQKISEPSIDELVEVTALACQKIVASGITSIHWLAESQVDVDILKKLHHLHKLPLRVFMVVPEHLLADPALCDCLVDGFAKIGGVEIKADGYLASKTAALFHPYANTQEETVNLSCLAKDIHNSICRATENGLQYLIHAMGDKAIDAALNAINKLPKKGRPRIDQPALFNEDLIKRVKTSKAILSIQPLVANSEFAIYSAIETLGEKRARWLYPLKTLFRKGICVCGGSDCPMEPLNPFLAMQSAVTRQAFPEEQITVEEAIQMYTTNAAYSTHEEKIKGTIEEGKLADLTVISQNPFEVPANMIQKIIVEMTIINGEIIYQL
ncbi:MAG: amidohydrolase [Crenarchaeota archaeon]|nr:amidohydrolase [Thermoproteota archaeon]